MRPTLSGVTINDMPLAEVLSGDESIEISIPTPLANGQVVHKTFKTTINHMLRVYVPAHDNPHQVTAEQVGSYTIEQVQELLREKMGLDGIAVNSMRLDGKTRQEIVDEARDGLVADSMKLGGQLPAHYAKDDDFNMLVDQLTQSFISASEF
jgi:hypothetical protein